jgi:hypothetical protein
LQQQKEVSTHAAGEIFVSLFPLPLCILSEFKRRRFPLLAQREVSTPEKSAIALSTYVCTAMLSRYRKGKISTLHNF